MTREARIWISATLLIIIIFNYIAIALPLYNRLNSIEGKIKIMMINQVKRGDVFKNSEDNYIIDVLKRETVNLDRKIVIVNCAAASVVAIVISWLLFAFFGCKGKRGKP